MSDAYTFYFQDVIPDYDTWKAIMTEYGVIDYDTASAEVTAFDEWAYNVLKRRFYNVNIRYTEPEAFYAALSLVYENRYKMYIQQKSIIDKLYNLTDDELSLISQAINNAANNPNDEPTDPKQPLQFVSAQTFQYVQDNKLKAYLTAVNNLPSLKMFDFIRGQTSDDDMSFQDLFMQVLPNNKYFFRR